MLCSSRDDVTWVKWLPAFGVGDGSLASDNLKLVLIFNIFELVMQKFLQVVIF